MADFKIRFITRPGFIDATIRAVTSSEWSHTEIILPDGSYLGSVNPGGVKIRPANYCAPSRERRYAIPVTDAQLALMMDFAYKQIGKPYDVKDIFSILLRRNWDDPNAWICSELVAATAQAGDLFLLNVIPNFTHRITPEMLHLSSHLIEKCYYSVSV